MMGSLWLFWPYTTTTISFLTQKMHVCTCVYTPPHTHTFQPRAVRVDSGGNTGHKVLSFIFSLGGVGLNRNLFSYSFGCWNSKIEVVSRLVSSEAPFLGCQVAAVLLPLSMVVSVHKSFISPQRAFRNSLCSVSSALPGIFFFLLKPRSTELD